MGNRVHGLFSQMIFVHSATPLNVETSFEMSLEPEIVKSTIHGYNIQDKRVIRNKFSYF